MTICNPIDCNRSDSSVHGVLQARILEWVAMLSSRGSSQPRDQTQLSFCFLHWQVSSLSLAPPGKPLVSILETLKQIWDNPSTGQTTGLNFLGCQEARDRAKDRETLSFLKLAQDQFWSMTHRTLRKRDRTYFLHESIFG